MKILKPFVRQERKIAKELKGKCQPGSGSQFHSKGDVKTNKFLIECKTTKNQSYGLKIKELVKIYQEATEEDLIPVMCIELDNEKTGRNYYVLTETDFKDLVKDYL